MGQSLGAKGPSERSLMNMMFSKWGHILRLYMLLKQLHWIISHEEMNKGSLTKYMQNLAKSL